MPGNSSELHLYGWLDLSNTSNICLGRAQAREFHHKPHSTNLPSTCPSHIDVEAPRCTQPHCPIPSPSQHKSLIPPDDSNRGLHARWPRHRPSRDGGSVRLPPRTAPRAGLADLYIYAGATPAPRASATRPDPQGPWSPTRALGRRSLSHRIRRAGRRRTSAADVPVH